MTADRETLIFLVLYNKSFISNGACSIVNHCDISLFKVSNELNDYKLIKVWQFLMCTVFINAHQYQ